MDCKHCLEPMNTDEILKCMVCQLLFHYGCMGMSEADYKKILPMNKAKWKCPDCKQIKKSNPKNSKVGDYANSDIIQHPSNVQAEFKPLLAQFDERFNRLNSTIESFKSFITLEFKQLSDTVNAWASKITLMETSVNSVVDRMNDIDKDLNKMKTLESEFNYLKNNFDELLMSNRKNEQWVRRSNIQINGVPYKKGENLINIIKSLAVQSGFQLNPNNDIDFVTRVAVRNDGKNNKSKPIILKMQARYRKDDFLSYLRKIKTLKACDIGFHGINTPIYANDHLSSYNKALLKEAKSKAEAKGYRFCWVRNCTIMVRRTEDSPVLHITSEECLKKIS